MGLLWLLLSNNFLERPFVCPWSSWWQRMTTNDTAIYLADLWHWVGRRRSCRDRKTWCWSDNDRAHRLSVGHLVWWDSIRSSADCSQCWHEGPPRTWTDQWSAGKRRHDVATSPIATRHVSAWPECSVQPALYRPTSYFLQCRLHRMPEIWTTAIDCSGVCLSVCYAGGLCKNGWTNRRPV